MFETRVWFFPACVQFSLRQVFLAQPLQVRFLKTIRETGLAP